MDVDIRPNETVAGTTDEPQGETPTEQPKTYTEEEVRKMIAEEVDKKARHFQSISDKAVKASKEEVRQARQSAELAEMKASEIERLVASNPQLAQAVRSASVQAQNRAYQSQASAAEIEKLKAQYVEDMRDTIQNEYGIDPNHPDIDWAEDAAKPVERTKRIMKSLAKIVRAGDKPKVEEPVRKNNGATMVDKTVSASGGMTDADFVRKFGIGDLPVTRANIDRYNKIRKSY